MIKTLSKEALAVIHKYENLDLPSSVKCPYHNNRRTKLKAGLRVLSGKGFPEEISDEAKLISLREKVDLKNLSKEETTKFLVEHGLGIDCSGFAFWILNEELKAQGKGGLVKNIRIASNRNILRKLIARFRPAENTGVRTLSDNENSQRVEITDARPADIIIMLRDDEDGKYNDHILIVKETHLDNQGKAQSIEYIHSIDWPSDGKYNTGIACGRIDINGNLMNSTWSERNTDPTRNYTYIKAQNAKVLEIRRLKALIEEKKINN